MRKKELRTVISFRTTTEAMAAEEAGKADGRQGRMIPVPRQITAGCGLAWSELPGQTPSAEEWLKRRRLCYERIYELVL